MRLTRLSFAFVVAGALVASACGGTGGGGGGGGAASPGASAAVSNEPIVFLSTQFNNVQESEAVRQQVLAGFTAAKVDYVGSEVGAFAERLVAESKTGKGTIGVTGGVHGDYTGLPNGPDLFEDLGPLADKLKDRGFPKEFLDLGKIGSNKQVYIPWLQATYILGINKQALQYLPSGVKADDITYAQLKDWCKNIAEKTGKKRCGFPAGPKSLMHRFIQGYLYPSYTGGLITTYKSADAVKMWTEFKDLWQYVNPQSTQIDFMQEALLSGEVWVGFDHVARLVEAFKLKPNDFQGAPAPKGPKGLYYMSVLTGLAIPKSSPNKGAAEKLIDYLTSPEIQAKQLNAVAFFPVLDKPLPQDLAPHLKIEADAVAKQSKASDAKVALLPIGLGAKGGEFNTVNLNTFQRIVIKGEDIQKVLTEEGTNLSKILQDSKAPCWRPDPPSSGPCEVK